MGDRKADSDTFHADQEQETTLKAWAKGEGVRVKMLPPELNVSGGLPLRQRPSLLTAVEGVEAGIYCGVAVAYVSRLGRNVREQLAVWDRVEQAGGRIVAVAENLDTSTAAGRLQRNLLLSIAEHEREQHVERFDNRRRLATEAGIWQFRQTPRGYRKGSDRRLVLDAKADEVRAAFADVLAGAPVLEVAQRIHMTGSGLRMLLRNRVYLGELTVGKYTNPAAHPPLLDRTTFDAVQRLLGERVRPPRSSAGPALLGGLVRCTSCGHGMSRSTGSAGNYYKCRRYHSGAECPAPAAVNSIKLERHVEAIALAELERLQVEASEAGGAADAQAELVAAEAELATYLDAVSAADLGAEAFAAGARKRREAVDAAKDTLHAEMARQPGNPTSGSGAEVWADLSGHERNRLLRGLLSLVLVRPVGRGRPTPIPARVRVLAYGAEVPTLPHRGEQPAGIAAIPFPDPDAIGVLAAPAGEDRLEAAGSAA